MSERYDDDHGGDGESESDAGGDEPTHTPILDHDRPLSAVAGVLAGQVARDLARPLRRLRENLAMTLDAVEQHLNRSEGPDPLPWKDVHSLRQELQDAYLLSRETARIAGELCDVTRLDEAEQSRPVDVNRQVESALALLHHRLEGIELFVDLGSVPPVRAQASELALVVAKLLLCAVDSARAVPGSAISIKTRYVNEEDGPVVRISILDNGAGVPLAAESARRALAPIMARLGGEFDGVSEKDRGSVFECVLPLGC